MAAAEVSLAGTVKSFQTAGHELSLRPSTAPLKPKDGLSGPPALVFVRCRLCGDRRNSAT